MAEYIMHNGAAIIGKPHWSMFALLTLFTDCPHRSCSVLCGHLLAKDGSGCHPKSYTALRISGAASDFTTMFGLFFWIEGPVKDLRSP